MKKKYTAPCIYIIPIEHASIMSTSWTTENGPGYGGDTDDNDDYEVLSKGGIWDDSEIE